jgi:hypothetical protein
VEEAEEEWLPPDVALKVVVEVAEKEGEAWMERGGRGLGSCWYSSNPQCCWEGERAWVWGGWGWDEEGGGGGP